MDEETHKKNLKEWLDEAIKALASGEDFNFGDWAVKGEYLVGSYMKDGGRGSSS